MSKLNLLPFFKKYKTSAFLLFLIAVISLIYSTHLSLKLIPKGYDLLFHLGNVFALQIRSTFQHNSLASFAISPLIFHDFGYGTHLFYPPLAHLIPAFIAFVMSKVGINSTLLAIRVFSFLTMFGSGLAMYHLAKKVSNNTTVAFFASVFYLSAPYLQMDYYWRGGMSSSLCFVFLPILLLSLYYFVKEKFSSFLFAFVISMTLITWTHLVTAFITYIIFGLLLVINFLFLKKKKAAIISLFLSGIMICLMTAPFWSLLVQQYLLKAHVIFGTAYPYNIENVAGQNLPFSMMFDLQLDVWNFKIRSLTAVFNIVVLLFFILFIVLFPKVRKKIKNYQFFNSLVALFVGLLVLVNSKQIWLHLPEFFAFVQYPHRLLLEVTPVLSLLIALPFSLISKITRTKKILLGVLAVFIIVFTFVFNNFELYELGQIDYTTHSIIQAMGVEREYLPSETKANFETADDRPYEIIAVTNNVEATPSAKIIVNETPYLLAEISNNEGKKTAFEFPRLFYAGYKFTWQADNNNKKVTLPYQEGRYGFMQADVTGNGTLELQYTGGQWYPLIWTGAILCGGYLAFLIYQSLVKKKKIWLDKI